MSVIGENMKKMVQSNQLDLLDGEIRLFDFRMGMLPVFTWTKLIEKLYRKNGEEAFEILFEVGKDHGQYAIDKIGKENDISKKRFLNQSLYTADVLGLGKIRVEKLNINSGEIVFRLENSPFKEYFEDSEMLSDIDGTIDYLQLGMAQKVSEEVLGGEVETEETECTFQGDDCCRIVARREEQ